jgi:hypothetical protein
MKQITLGIIIIIGIMLVVVSSGGNAIAYHDGSVAHCDGCHTMHNSLGGNPMTVTGADPASYLTLGTDSSSTCLKCHKSDTKSYAVLTTTGGKYSAGGDFYWLTKTFTWGTSSTSKGENHGHNIVAADYGMVADATRTTAPGGAFPSNYLSCASCHNPHGTVTSRTGAVIGSGSYGGVDGAGGIYGNYRILGDVGYQSAGAPGPFLNKPPVAYAPSLSTAETDTAHVDYGSGVSEWCANCHGTFVNSGKHPIQQLNSTISTNYNNYISTGTVGGSPATSYLALVSFERNTTNVADLNPNSTTGTTSSSKVMCLTCHRAHASAFNASFRWDYTAALISASHPAATDGGVTGNDVLNSYYGRNMVAQFGAEQRSLCNKCHMQD